MNVDNYPKCRTCRHYFESCATADIGFCKAITRQFAQAWTPATPFDDEYTDESLGVLPTFGCLLHSELETDQQKGEG